MTGRFTNKEQKDQEEATKKKVFDIRERAFAFAVRIVKLCQRLEAKGGVCRTISFQLLKAGTSVGANLEEAKAGQSKADFISKNSVSLKEARESHYWLRLILAAELLTDDEVVDLKDEAESLMKIIGSIVTSAKKNLD